MAMFFLTTSSVAYLHCILAYHHVKYAGVYLLVLAASWHSLLAQEVDRDAIWLAVNNHNLTFPFPKKLPTQSVKLLIAWVAILVYHS